MRVEKNVLQAPPAQRQAMKKSLALAAAIAVAGLAAPASAELVWEGNGTGTGNWGTPTNWDLGYEPTSFDVALLNNGDTILIDQPGEEADIFDIGRGVEGVSEVGTGTLQMTGGSLTASAGIRFGVDEDGTGNLNMSGGSMQTVGGFNLILFGDWGDSLGNSVSGGEMTANIVGIGFQPTSEASLDLSGTGELIGRDNIEIGAGRNNDTGEQAHGTVNMTGGTITTVGQYANGDPSRGDVVLGFGGVGTLNMSGGTINSADTVVLGIFGGFRNNDTATDIPAAMGTVNQSGGDVNGTIILIGEGGNAEYNMDGGTMDASLSVEVGRFSQSAVFNQSGDAVVSAGNRPFFDAGLVVGDSGTGTYNLSGNAQFTTESAIMAGAYSGTGVINQSENSTVNATNMFLGKRNTGTYNLSGGALNLSGDAFLGDFDNSTGTFVHSGGTLNIGGNLSVGAALASNAPDDPLEPSEENGPQGQALNTTGIFHVVGSGDSINIGGDLLANPDDKGDARSGPGLDNHATLIFETDAGGVTPIMVGGVADLDGAIIDIDDAGGYFTVNETLTLIDAAAGLANGGAGWVLTQGDGEGFMLAEEDQDVYLLDVVSNGSGGEMLVASLIPEPTTAVVGMIGGLGLLLRRRRA